MFSHIERNLGAEDTLEVFWTTGVWTAQISTTVNGVNSVLAAASGVSIHEALEALDVKLTFISF